MSNFGGGYTSLSLDRFPIKCTPAKRYELQLDLDSEEDIVHLDRMWLRFRDDLHDQGICDLSPVTYKQSSTPGHYHALITVVPILDITETDMVLLQAVLGSDRVRELRNWGRVKKGIEPYRVLIEKGSKNCPVGGSNALES